MASSKDNEGSVLVASTNPQIVANLGFQDGYPRVPIQHPQTSFPPAYPPPGFHEPGNPNNINLSYPQSETQGFQAPNPQVIPPNPQDNPQGVNPQGSSMKVLAGVYLQEGVYPQEGRFVGNASSDPPGFKATELNDSNMNTTDQIDGEAGMFKTLDFTEKTIRRAFIRKVYGILTCQLLITIGFISLFLFHEPIKRWAADNPYMLIFAFVVYFTMAFSMICFSEVRRKAPMNLIFLGLFTVATGYMLGTITSTYDVDSVMMAVGITAAVVFSLTLFALQTKYDFTGIGGSLLCALVILLLMGIMWPIMPNKILDIVYASIGALIFSLYIVYDTQLMLGGDHKYTISPEEYIFAALNLYLDVINLFIRILYLIGRR